MKEYIEREAAIKTINKLRIGLRTQGAYEFDLVAADAKYRIESIPAADVVEVRQIRAFIDRLIAERDKYDLHSMRWEHYDCDRLLIELMLDEMDGGVNDGKTD